jgi:hypothetical protein
VKSIPQQITGLPKTPVVQAGVVSPGASGSPALPQVTEEEEEEGSAGDPIEGDDAIAQTNAAAKALTDAAAAIANAEAAAPQANANAAKEKAQTQATQAQEPTKSEAPLEGQLESTEKEVMPAVTVDMAALMVVMQSMQNDNATRMSALQAATGTDQPVCAAISTCNETSISTEPRSCSTACAASISTEPRSCSTACAASISTEPRICSSINGDSINGYYSTNADTVMNTTSAK